MYDSFDNTYQVFCFYLLVVFILFASNIQGAFKNSLFYIVMDIKALSVICKMLYKYKV